MVDIVASVRFGPRVLSRETRVIIGSSVPVTLEFRDRDANDAGYAVSGVALALTRPDGTTVSWNQAALTAGATGVWTVVATPSQLTGLGDHRFVASCSSPTPEAAAGIVRVLAVNDTSMGDGGAVPEGSAATAAAGSAASAASSAASASALATAKQDKLVAVTKMGAQLENTRPREILDRHGERQNLRDWWSGTGDAAVAFNALAAEVAARGGGVIEYVPGDRPVIDTADVEIPMGCALQPVGYGRPRGQVKAAGSVETDYTRTDAGALFVKSTRTVKVRAGAAVRGNQILRQGLGKITNLTTALSEAAAMAGTALTLGYGGSGNRSNDVEIAHNHFVGFDRAIDGKNMPRLLIDDLRGDCRNPVYLEDIGSLPWLGRMHFFPFLTNGAEGGALAGHTITAIGAGTGGRFRVTIGPVDSGENGNIPTDYRAQFQHLMEVNVAECTGTGASAINRRWKLFDIGNSAVTTIWELVAPASTSGSTVEGPLFNGGLTYTASRLWSYPGRRSGTGFWLKDVGGHLGHVYAKGFDTGYILDSCTIEWQYLEYEGQVELWDDLNRGVRVLNANRGLRGMGGSINSAAEPLYFDALCSGESRLFGMNFDGGRDWSLFQEGGTLELLGCDFSKGRGTAAWYALLGNGAVGLAVHGDNLVDFAAHPSNTAANLAKIRRSVTAPIGALGGIVPTVLTATTTDAASTALTTGGGAAAGTASGFAIAADRLAQGLAITVTAQRTNGSGAGTNSECALWSLAPLLSRGGSVGSTVIVRAGGLGPLAPTEFNDADAGAWRLTLATNGAGLVVNVTGAAGATIAWRAEILAVQAG